MGVNEGGLVSPRWWHMFAAHRDRINGFWCDDCSVTSPHLDLVAMFLFVSSGDGNLV